MRLSEGLDEDTIFIMDGIERKLPPIRNTFLSLRYVQKLRKFAYQAVSRLFL